MLDLHEIFTWVAKSRNKDGYISLHVTKGKVHLMASISVSVTF